MARLQQKVCGKKPLKRAKGRETDKWRISLGEFLARYDGSFAIRQENGRLQGQKNKGRGYYRTKQDGEKQ